MNHKDTEFSVKEKFSGFKKTIYVKIPINGDA
jgi:hypothetical protein